MGIKPFDQLTVERRQNLIDLHGAIFHATSPEQILEGICGITAFRQTTGAEVGVSPSKAYYNAIAPKNQGEDLVIKFNDEDYFFLQYQNQQYRFEIQTLSADGASHKRINFTIIDANDESNLFCRLSIFPEGEVPPQITIENEKLPVGVLVETERSESIALGYFQELFCKVIRQDFCGFWLRLHLWTSM